MKSLLRYGSTGPLVVELQHRLNAARGPSSPALNVDGIFGPRTLARVKEFQVQGVPVLAADGIVGPLSWSKLLATTRDDLTAIASQIQTLSAFAPFPLAHLIKLSMLHVDDPGARR